MEYIKTSDNGEILLGKTKEDAVLLCDWYIGFCDHIIESGNTDLFKRMEFLN